MHAWFFKDWWGDFCQRFLGIEGVVGISAYGTMMTLAFVCGFALTMLIYRSYSLKKSQLSWLVVYMAVFGLLGAHLFSLLFRIGEIDFSTWDSFLETSLFLFSNLMYYGGFLGGLIGLIVFSKKENVNFYSMGDMVLTVLPLCHAIGRVGCYLAGCCYGRQTDGPLGVDFIYGNSQGRVIPTQLFEVGFNCLLFIAIVTIFIFVYKKGEKNEQNRGLICGVYLTAYPIFRFIIEFFRADTRGTILGMSVAQFISIFLLAFGVYILANYFSKKRLKKSQVSS